MVIAMKDTYISDLMDRLDRRDWVALGKAITIVENGYEGKEQLLNYAYQTNREQSLIIGITGAGGAGKSTLIDSILQTYVRQGKHVGVLAVDPSSAYTGGAVLGDRIRMGKHANSENVFIRSFGSRGALGGISQGAKDVLYLYKAFGFDVIILESLGVGQAETDITSFVDVTAVVLAPGNGDYIQLSKAGTQEIADIFVVNKADSVEAEALYMQLCASFELFPEERRPCVIKTVAREHIGVEELTELFQKAGVRLIQGRGTKKRMRIMNEIQSNALLMVSPMLKCQVERLAERVLADELTPFEAAVQLGKRITFTPETQ